MLEIAKIIDRKLQYLCLCKFTSYHRHGARLPLFLREDGSIPNRAWFDAKLFSFISHDYGGHSLRAGSATYYASLGLSDSIIQALGRWSSSAWKIYIRDNPSIRAEQQLTSIRLHHLHN